MRKTIAFWRKTFVSFLVFAFLLNNLSAFALKPASSFQIASPTPGAKQFKEALFSDIKFRTVALSIINHLFFKQLNKETLPKTIRDKFRNSPDFLTGINLEEVYQENDNIYVPYKKSLIQIQLTKSEIPPKTDLTQNVYKGYNIRITRAPEEIKAKDDVISHADCEELIKQEAAEEAVQHFIKLANLYNKKQIYVGLGSGTTMQYVLKRLGIAINKGEINKQLIGVATSVESARLAKESGIHLTSLENCRELDFAIDGADEIDINTFQMIKGKGGYLTEEKKVIKSAKKVIIAVQADKIVPCLGSKHSVPIEIQNVDVKNKVIRNINKLLRYFSGYLYRVTDEGRHILDIKIRPKTFTSFTTKQLENRINSIDGVIDNGIFSCRPDVIIVSGLHNGKVCILNTHSKIARVQFRNIIRTSNSLKQQNKSDNTIALENEYKTFPLKTPVALTTRKLLHKNIKKVALIRAYPTNTSKEERRQEIRLPLGLCYLYAALKQRFKELNISFLDLVTQKENFDIRKFLAEGDFDLIGISTAASIYTEEANHIAKTAREISPDSLIITGGTAASSAPLETVKTGLYDAVFEKDGEESIVRFIETVSSGHGNLAYLKGCWYLNENGKVCNNGEPVYPDLDQVDFMLGLKAINIDEYNLASEYFDGQRTIHLITSRGCPYQCSFCVVPAVSGRRYASMSAQKLVDLLKKLKQNYKIRNFNFDNDIFSLDKKFVYEFCNLILAEEELSDIHWKITTRADLLDEDTLKLMYKAGLRFVAIALETADQAVLDKVNKKLKLCDVENATLMAQDLGIKVRYYIMIALPEQTEASLKATEEFIKKNKPDEAFVTVYVPVPGSPISKEPERYGVKILVRDPKLYWMRDIRRRSDEGASLAKIEETALVETNWLSAEEIIKWRKRLMKAVADAKPVPLSGLADKQVKDYITTALVEGYAHLGISKDEVQKFVDIMCLHQDNPETAINAVKKEMPFLFGDPNGKFFKGYKEYRSIQGKRYEWLNKLVPKEILRGRLVDIGCANNRFGKYLLEYLDGKIESITGIDTIKYEDVVTMPSRLNFVQIEDKNSFAQELVPFAENSIDIATVIYSLHHMLYKIHLLELRQLYEKMKPNGKVIVVEDTYNISSPEEAITGLVSQFLLLSEKQKYLTLKFFDWMTNSPITYPNIPRNVPIPGAFRSMPEWKRIFEEAGFEILEQRFVGIPKERVHRVPMGYFLLQKPQTPDNRNNDCVTVATAENVTIDYTNVTSEVIQAGGLTTDDLDRQRQVLTSETIKKRLQDSISNGFLCWPDEMLANSGKIDKICKQWERYQDIIILGAPRLSEALVNYYGIKSKYKRLHFIDTLEAEKFGDMLVLPGFSWDKTCVAVISQGAGGIIQKTNLEWLKNKINDPSRIAVIANKENPLLNETNSQNRLITISLKNNENVLNFSGTAVALGLGLAGINYKEFAGYVKTSVSKNIDDSAAVKFASVIRALSVKQNHKGEFIDTIMLLSYDKRAQSVIDAAVSSANARLSSIRTYIGSNAPEANHEDYQIAMGKNGTLMALISPKKWTSNQIIPASAKPRWRSTHEETYTTAQFMDVSKKGIKTDLTEFNDHNIDITFTQDLKGITELVVLFQLAGELDYLAVEEKHIFTESLTEFDDSFAQIPDEPALTGQTYTAVMADGKSVMDIGGLVGDKEGCLNKTDLDNAFLKVEEAMALVKTGHDVEGKHIYLNEPDEAMTKTEIADSRKMAQLASFGKKNIIFLGIGATHNTIKFGAQPLQGFYANETDNTKVKKVFFGGNTIDPREIDELLEIIDREPDDTLIVYTSYSGETAESDIVFRILQECLIKKAKILSLDDTEAIKHLTEEADYTQSVPSLLIDECVKFAKKENLTLAQYEFIRNHLLFITGKRGSLNTEVAARGFRTLRHPLSSGRHAIFTTAVYAMEILGLNADSFIKSGREYVDKIFSEDKKVPLLAKDPGFTAGALTGCLSRVKKRPKIKIVDFSERLAGAGVWRDKHMINESLNKPHISTIAENMEISDLLSLFASLPKDDKSIYVLFSDVNKSEALSVQKEALLRAIQSFLKNHGIPFLTFQIETALKEKSHANLILAWEQFVLGYGCVISDAAQGYGADEHSYGQEKCEKARMAVDKAADETRGRKQAAIDDVVEQFALRDEALIRTAETAVHAGQRYFDIIKGKNLIEFWGRPNAQADKLVEDTIESFKGPCDIRAVITIHPITRVPIVNKEGFHKDGKFVVWTFPADNLIEGFNPLSSGGNPGSIIVISESEGPLNFKNIKMILEFIHGPGDEPGVMVWAKNEMLGVPSVYSYAKIDGVLVPRVVLKAGSHITNIPEKRGQDSFTITDSQTDLPPAITILWNKARKAGIRSRNFKGPVSNIAKLINGGITEFTTTWFEAYIHAVFAEGMGGKVKIITKNGDVLDSSDLFKEDITLENISGIKASQKVMFTAGDPEWMLDLEKILKEEDTKPKNLPDPLWVSDEAEFSLQDKPTLRGFLQNKQTDSNLIHIVDLWAMASIKFGNEYKKITMLKPIGTANIASEVQYLADIKADEIYHEIFEKNRGLIYVSVSEERAVTRYDKDALFASYCDPVDGVKNLLQGFVTGNIEAITFKDGSGGISMQLLQGANILIFSDNSGTYSAIWDGKDFRVLYEYEYANPVPWSKSNIAVGGADNKYDATHPEIDKLLDILLKGGYDSDNAYGMLIDTARILDRSRERTFKHKLIPVHENAGIYKLDPLKREIKGGLLRSGGYLYLDMGGAKSRPEIADLGGKMRLTELIAQCREIAKVKRSKTGKGLAWHFGTNKNLDRIIVAYNDENLPRLSYPCFLGVDDGLFKQINKYMWDSYVKNGFASPLQAITAFEKYDVKDDPDYEKALDIDSKGRVYRLKKNPHMGMVRIQEPGGWRSYSVHGRVECLDVEAIANGPDKQKLLSSITDALYHDKHDVRDVIIKLHELNMNLLPPVEKSKTLWHIIPIDLVPFEIRADFVKTISETDKTYPNLREKIKIVTERQELSDIAARLAGDSNNIVTVAARDTGDLTKLPQGVKALVFTGELGNFRQLHGIIAALRALHQNDVESLLKLYEILCGRAFTGHDKSEILNYISDPKKLAGIITFDLVPYNVENLRELNESLLTFIRSL